MSFFNYILPHRFLINNSLRKESEKLRSKINSYQTEYENRIEECQNELRSIEQKKDAEYEKLKKALTRDLYKTKAVLDELGKNIMQYADDYFQRNYLYDTKKLMQAKRDLLNENLDFLNKQRDLINEEIEILCSRQEELSSNVNVTDIIQLSNNSGCDFGFTLDDDAKTLLGKINENIKRIDSENKVIEKYTLIRLRKIVQERAEYLPLIKYIDWLIQQKKLTKKLIFNKRSEILKEKKTIKLEIDDINNEINVLNISLSRLAKAIRYYWAVPLTLISADITYKYQEKTNNQQVFQEKINEIKEIRSELHSLAEMHSNDQGRWNTLTELQDDLQSEIDSLKSEIDDIEQNIDKGKRERNQWYEKKNCIFSFFKNNNIYLISDKEQKESDESCIIQNRLAELEEEKKSRPMSSAKIQEEEKLLLLKQELEKQNKRNIR